MEEKEVLIDTSIDQESIILEEPESHLEEEEVENVAPEEDVTDSTDSEEVDSLDEPEDIKKSEHNSSFHLKELRRRYRELKKEVYHLKSKESFRNEDVPLPNKPTLSECDYDEEEYQEKLLRWHEHQRRQKEIDELRRREEESEQQQWQEKIKNYELLKKQLPFSDKQDVEEIVSDYLSKEQMGTILNVCDNPALVLYALSKSSNKLESLSGIKDYLKFAASVAKIESSIKVSKKSEKRSFSEESVNTSSKSSSAAAIKKLVEKALLSKNGVYKLLQERPELKGKIEQYI